jgi:hypothetical protein
MSYRLLLQKLCWRIFAKLDRPPEQIAQQETLTRFIFSARHFDSKKNVIDSAAFLPPKDGKQSIYRIDGCSDTKIWWLGDCYVTRKRKDRKKALARGDFPTSLPLGLGLTVTTVRKPHPRHAHIEGWPAGKALQKINAIQLADNARLVVPP